MELELQKQQLHCYEVVSDMAVTHEETTEMIVPEYCPDIARVVDAEGCLLLRKREMAEHKLTIAGVIQSTVLYVPEEGGGLRALTASMPFCCTTDAHAVEQCAHLRVHGQLLGLEARLLNPRKLHLRAQMVFDVEGFRPTVMQVCSDLKEQEKWGVELLREQQEASIVIAVKEKDFSVEELVALSTGKEPIEELLLTRVHIIPTETKSVTSKLVAKGVFNLELVYRSRAQNICRATAEVPFSQILEGVETTGTLQCGAPAVWLTGAEFRVDSEGDASDGRGIFCQLQCGLAITLREERTLSFLCELYSTKYEITTQAQPLLLRGMTQAATRRQSASEQLELGATVRAVLDSTVRCGAVSFTREGDTVTLRTDAAIRVLYLDEGNVPLVAQRHSEVRCQLDLPPACRCRCTADCGGEVAAVVSSEGIELRFPVDFHLEVCTEHACACITGGKFDADTPRDFSAAPSLILRELQPQERLWDIARQYCSTVQDILQANELTEETASGGGLLLIPRKR